MVPVWLGIAISVRVSLDLYWGWNLSCVCGIELYWALNTSTVPVHWALNMLCLCNTAQPGIVCITWHAAAVLQYRYEGCSGAHEAQLASLCGRTRARALGEGCRWVRRSAWHVCGQVRTFVRVRGVEVVLQYDCTIRRTLRYEISH